MGAIDSVRDVSPASSGQARRIHRGCCLLGVLLVIAGIQAPAQDHSTELSPTESYKAALQPFNATRSQINDLTDADRIALGIGMAQAARDCLALSAHASAFAGDANEQFALGQLCIFGQQYEPARATLVEYLAQSKPQQREQARLLLVRAFLGLKHPENAAAQVRSLLLDLPYDASIHLSIDQIIDDSEGAATYLNELALELCATQNAATLPLLAGGKALEGKDTSVSAATLFADAVRCSALASASSKPLQEQKPVAGDSDNLQQLAGILQQSNWTGTADRAPMQSALQRQQMVGRESPIPSVHGQLVGAKTLVARTVSLAHGAVLLIPFTLWSPSVTEIAQDVIRLAPQQPIYAITSWSANTGREDAPSSQVLDGLRSLQLGLPAHVSLLVVPDTVMNAFHADSFPAGILIRDGTVLSNGVLSSHGAERCLVNPLINGVAQSAGPAGKRLGAKPASKAN